MRGLSVRWRGVGGAPAGPAAAPPGRVRDPASGARLDWGLASAPAGPAAAVVQAGEAALALWGAGRQVYALDDDPAALALLGLKAAAMEALKPPSRAALLGLDAAGRRLWFLHFLRPALAPDHQKFWDAREALVRRGLADGGALEARLLRWAGRARAAPSDGAARLLLRAGLRDFGPRVDRLVAHARHRGPSDVAVVGWLRGEPSALGLPSVTGAAGEAGALVPVPPGPLPAALGALPPLAILDLGDALERCPPGARGPLLAAARRALLPGGLLLWWGGRSAVEAPMGFVARAQGPEAVHPWAAAWGAASPSRPG